MTADVEGNDGEQGESRLRVRFAGQVSTTEFVRPPGDTVGLEPIEL